MPTLGPDRIPSRVSTGPVPARPNEVGSVAPDGVVWMTVIEGLGTRLALGTRGAAAGRATVGRIGVPRNTGTARPVR